MSFPICQKFREKRPGWQLEAPKAPEALKAPEVADGWCMLCTMTIRRPAQWSNGAMEHEIHWIPLVYSSLGGT